MVLKHYFDQFFVLIEENYTFFKFFFMYIFHNIYVLIHDINDKEIHSKTFFSFVAKYTIIKRLKKNLKCNSWQLKTMKAQHH